jgi:L-fuconolactonase
MQPPAIDAHQHFWNPERVPLPWLRAEHAPIARAFEPAELEPQLARANVSATVLVQSACADGDTELMLEHAARHDWIGAVVAWLPLENPQRASDRLDELRRQPKVRGIRHLIHDEPDPHWVLRPPVLESLALLEAAGFVLELPVVFPRHLEDVPQLATRFPALTIVIDHLGKPPIGRDGFPVWADQLETAAAYPNVFAKISGLNTTLDRPGWSAFDLVPAIEVALRAFGPDRLLCGSDWPVSLLNDGEYERIWTETRRAIDVVAPDDAATLLSGTARGLYGLDFVGPEPVLARSSREGSDGAH